MGAVLIRAWVLLAVPLAASVAAAADAPQASAKEDVPLSAYSALGSSMVINGRLTALGWNDEQIAAFLEGMRAAFQGKPVPMDAAAQALAAETGRKVAAAASPGGGLAAFLKDAKARYGLQVSTSGLAYNVTPGRNGIRPRPGDEVVFSCKVSGPDGALLPSLSSDRVRSRVDDLIPGLREGLQMMVVGSRALFVLPPDLTFGRGSWPEGLRPGSPLVYRIVLDDVQTAGP
jgi:FKBP-type peptidyl-prolyl cis-trans isomerase FkpA